MCDYGIVWSRVGKGSNLHKDTPELAGGEGGEPLSQLYDKEASRASISDCVHVIYH